MFPLFKITSLIYLLFSSNFWLALWLPSTPIILLTNIIMLLCVIGDKIVRIRMTSRFLLLICCLMGITIWYAVISGVIYGIVMCLSYLPAVYLYVLPYNRKVSLLKFVTKWYGIMVAFSMVVFFSVLYLNYSPPLAIFVAEEFNYPPYLNYGLYLKSTGDYGLIPRFNAFFLEPGHLALISTFLLIANQFKFKDKPYCYVLLLSVLMSFSLAGYVLLGVSYALYTIKNVKTLLAIATMGGVLFLGSQLWNNGNNIINELIFSRLEYDESKGVSGNNRTTPETDALFDVMVSSGEIVKGIENKEDPRIRGAGYKIFLIKYGVITTVLVFAFYFCLIPKRVNRKYALIFLLVIILCFLQRAYPWWYSWLLPFTLGTGTVLIQSRKRKKQIELALGEDNVRISKGMSGEIGNSYNVCLD